MRAMSRLRVRVYGDSLALPRPGVVGNEERYVALLEDWWRSRGIAVELVDRSRANGTVIEARDNWVHDNAYFGEAVDVLIAHCGICDCAPRPLKPWERAWVSRLPPRARDKVVDLIHRFRPQLVQARTIRVVPISTFRDVYRDWLAKVVANAKRTYVINIAPTNADMEQRSPGWMESIQAYNAVIRETVEHVGRATLVDIHDAIAKSPDGIDAWVVREDGHHIMPRTHRALFEQIRERELSASARAS
jgi:hypothetical protein